MNRGVLVLFIAVAGILYLSLKSKLIDDAVPREKLSSIINSEFQEVRPMISPDGKTLYFSRRNHPENTGGARDYQDIWVSKFLNGAWSEPTKLEGSLNNKKTNTLCSITSDGSYALLLDSYKGVKTPLVQAYDSPAGWGAPGELFIQDFTNKSSYYDFYYQEHQEVIISAIDDGRGYGEQDLHVSFKRPDGSYSKPKNLGNVVNSNQSDFAPFLAADGKTLYFASFGHEGLGGSDFYVSYRLDNGWKRWTEPKNLGVGINSEFDENYLSITADFKYVYFESYPTGAEEKDIYRAPLPRQFHPQHLAPQPETGEAIAVATPDSEPTPVVTPTPIDPSTTREIFAQTETPVTSAYPRHRGTQPVVDGETNIDSEMQSVGRLITRQFFQEGQVKSKVLRNNYFPYNSYELSPASLSSLNEIAKVLQSNPNMEAQVVGHADSWGTDQVNLRVSYLRALSAAHYLIDLGISGNRLQVTGNGEEQPLASNDDEAEGRELNRRVEITLVGAATAYKFTIY